MDGGREAGREGWLTPLCDADCRPTVLLHHGLKTASLDPPVTCRLKTGVQVVSGPNLRVLTSPLRWGDIGWD